MKRLVLWELIWVGVVLGLFFSVLSLSPEKKPEMATFTAFLAPSLISFTLSVEEGGWIRRITALAAILGAWFGIAAWALKPGGLTVLLLMAVVVFLLIRRFLGCVKDTAEKLKKPKRWVISSLVAEMIAIATPIAVVIL